MSRSSFPTVASVASVAIVFTPAVLGAQLGCVRAAHMPNVRPAANGETEDIAPSRFFSPPIAIAVAEDAIVRVVGPQMTCSGTLVEDDLVLTAHHCVVERRANGEFTKGLLKGSDVRVELGGDYLPWGNVRVREIVAPMCGEAGGAGDLAVLVLERKLVGLSTMTARLDEPPRVGETLGPAGFGRCALSPDGIHRQARAGGRIVSLTQSGTLRMDASICPGDSGGPVLAGGREVVGVVSLSAMDSDERTRSPSIMARLDTFRAVFSNARLIADGASPSELPPITCAK